MVMAGRLAQRMAKAVFLDFPGESPEDRARRFQELVTASLPLALQQGGLGETGGTSRSSHQGTQPRSSFTWGDLERGALPAKGIRDLEKVCPPLCPDNKKPIR